MLDKNFVYDNLKNNLKLKNVLRDELMSKHTSFKTGGPADFFVVVENEEELKKIIEYVNKENIPLFVIGNGTNILVTDKGIRGIVVKLKLQDILVEEEKNEIFIQADSGVPVIKLAKIAKEYSATGLEFAAGIPGTLGGAIRMNAGAYGSEMKEIIKSTTYIDLKGNIKTISNDEQKFSYRNSIFSKLNVIILKAKIQLKKENIENIESKMNENIKSRNEKQPIDKPNAGSTFKRGTNYITAKLIDECGLKGYKIGGAEVSKKHAGFVINSGNATSKDILELIDYIKKEVKEKFNVTIEPEIQIIGEE